jgi:tetratricopeptide (TPR) repeat protein
MSAAAVEESDDTMILCASCGIAGANDIKLKKCNGCYLVKYCSVKCQKDHRPQHKKECKKRAAELKDEILFKQPESSCFGDCPICYLPLPIDQIKCFMTPCCSKSVCIGCDYVDMKLVRERNLLQKCPFCREVLPSTEEESNKLLMKRIEANDPYALRELGTTKYYEGDCKSAFDYWSRAADLGDAVAHYQLSCLYFDGEGVEKDEKKELHHLEQAAIGGHPGARHNLGCKEWENGRVDRAVKHLIIAAKLGNDKSLGSLKNLHGGGYVSKDDFAAALRDHKAAIDATKSPQREEAANLRFSWF